MTIVEFDQSRVRAPQHRRDASALLAFPHLLGPADTAFAEWMASTIHCSERDRIRLFGLCVEVGRARFREGR